MTETRALTVPNILLALRAHFRSSCNIAACNTFALHDSFESDFLAMTASSFLHEVEIKLSRADFKADFKKEGWSKALSLDAGYDRVKKHDLIQSGQLANYFWFAVPEGLIELADVPEYAGLLLLRPSRLYYVKVQEARKAPRIHREKVSAIMREQIKACMMHRAWEGMTTIRNLSDRVDRLEAELALANKPKPDPDPNPKIQPVPGQLSLFGSEAHA